MCGIFGFVSGVDTLNEDQRRKFTVAGGAGVDNRGGHASGYVSVDQKTNTIRYCKKLGRWMRAKQRFLTTAADGNILMGHARFATCGSKEEVQHAHPFAVKRNGQIKLWGAHNGIIHGAFESAKKRGRDIGVDSQEIFELIVDKDHEAIQKLSGYGVVTWIEAAHHDYVNLVKLSSGGDIVVYTLKEGGVVWASTSYILDEALKLSGLHCDQEYKSLEVGKVYQIRADGLYETNVDGIKLDSLHSQRSTYHGQNYWSNINKDSEYPRSSASSYYADTRDHETFCRCASCLSKKSTAPTNAHTNHHRYVPLWQGEVTRQNGDKEWYVKDKLHRTDGPARICANGQQEWWINGEKHRDGAPAIIKANGDKEWYQHDKLHRLDGPALEFASGDFGWYRENKFHREDGPALKYANASGITVPWEGYYLDNKFFHNKEEFEKGLVVWKAEQAALEKVKQSNPEEVSKAKDHAFLRELKAFWLKFDDQKEKGDDAWGKNSSDPVALRNVQA